MFILPLTSSQRDSVFDKSMITKVLTSIFGSKHDRLVKGILPSINEINGYYEEYKKSLGDEDVPLKTSEFRQRIEDGESLDDILPEAFGLVKDACRRLMGTSWDVVGNQTEWDMIPYDVQLIGGIILHQGKIAEMATGEGKTLVATLPLYLNSLTGRGVHLVTVNDYLALRDSEWMGGLFKFLGVSVGCIINKMSLEERRKNYAKDIKYGTNNEFGFDYLRDNMSTRPEDVVQREHHYSIVDEVDSVLVDEARTPLIIAGPARQSNQQYERLRPAVEQLVKKQRNRVSDFVKQCEVLLKEDSEENEYEIGELILKANRSAPKHPKIIKLLSETGMKSLMQQVENDYLRDKKLHLLDEELLYVIDEKQHTIDLTEEGRDVLVSFEGGDAEMFVLPDLAEGASEIDMREDLSPEEKLEEKDKFQSLYAERSERIHTISQLLRAYSLFEKDVEYVVQDSKVMIVDEFTGRLMTGRRYSDGLHQSIEAKERVKIEGETQTVATITLQNYFRLYDKLAGMTGTAETEEAEFWDIYKLEVAVIPTNAPINRVDNDDVIFKTKREKYNAIIEEVKELNSENLPVLIGTTTVDVSETLSRMLRRQNIKHNVLNAKHNKSEAEIIKYAGQPGAVTIATNMAGRGTDIKLADNVVRWKGKEGDKSQAEGGLHVLGTERHESRRIDRQLRGRSGRQGDPGATIFYLSLDDNLMRLFGSERISKIMDRLGVDEGDVITHPMITRSIEKAQKRVEGYNFGIRKNLIEYDNVMNQQREVIYRRRRQILFEEDISGVLGEVIDDYLDSLLDNTTDSHEAPDLWDQESIKLNLRRNLQIDPPDKELWKELSKPEDWHNHLSEKAQGTFHQRFKLYGEEKFLPYVRFIALRVIDEKWKDHLYEMDRLKEGVGLRAYGQKDPLIEYKREGFDMFRSMLDLTNEETLRIIFNSYIKEPDQNQQRGPQKLSYIHAEASAPGKVEEPSRGNVVPQGGNRKKQPVKVEQTVGRNEPCPCGSGKKYKKCHGA